MKPILFNTNMVKALLDGRKTVTRRVVKPQPIAEVRELYRKDDTDIWRSYGVDWWYEFRAPFIPGDILWVRESFVKLPETPGGHFRPNGVFYYKADQDERPEKFKKNGWHPSIHMPREAARIFLRVTEVRAERLQDITTKDIRAEGAVGRHFQAATRGAFADLWDSTIKPKDLPTYGWAANPWVWVIDFERISKEEALKDGKGD